MSHMFDRFIAAVAFVLDALGRLGPPDLAELGRYQRIEAGLIPPRDDVYDPADEVRAGTEP